MPAFYHRDDGLTHTTITFRPLWYGCRMGGLGLLLTSILVRDQVEVAYPLLFWVGWGLFIAPTIGTWSLRGEARQAMASGGLVVQGTSWNLRKPLTWTWLRR